MPLLCVLTFGITGCGDEKGTYPVEGRVIYPDGTPVTDGTVEFETMSGRKAITAASEIAPDGSFSLGTFAPKDGALPGKHRVAVIADYQIGTEMERPGLIPPPTIDDKYRSFKTSGLTFEIERGANLIEVIVERPIVDPASDADGEYLNGGNE